MLRDRHPLRLLHLLLFFLGEIFEHNLQYFTALVVVPVLVLTDCHNGQVSYIVQAGGWLEIFLSRLSPLAHVLQSYSDSALTMHPCTIACFKQC